MSDSSRAGWLRTMFDKSTVHRNDMMVVQFVVLFLARAIFRETSTGLDVKTVNVIVKNKSRTVSHGLFSYRPKLCSETTRPGPLVQLEFWTF